MLKKTRVKRNIPRPAKYYIDLGKQANMEQGLHNYSSWIGVELALLLEVILQDESILINGLQKNLSETSKKEEANTKSKIQPETKKKTKTKKKGDFEESDSKKPIPSKKIRATTNEIPYALTRQGTHNPTYSATGKPFIMSKNSEIEVQKALLSQFSSKAVPRVKAAKKRK